MRKLWVLFLFTLVFLPGQTALAQPVDVAGSSDHELISRYSGSVLIAFDKQDYDEYVLVLDLWDPAARKWMSSRSVEGKVSRRSYIAPEGTTLLTVFRNFEKAIAGAGLEVLFSCRTPSCGVGTRMASGITNAMPSRLRATDHYHNFQSAKDFGYIAAEGRFQGKQVWLAVGMAAKAAAGLRYRDANNRVQKLPTDRVVFFIDVIEGAAMATGMVTVNAEALQAGIERDGKVTLDGILFDTGKTVVKPESKAALDAVA